MSRSILNAVKSEKFENDPFMSYTDGAAGLAWPIPSAGKAGYLLAVVANGINIKENVPRVEVIYEAEDLRLVDMHKAYLEMWKLHGAKLKQGCYANTKIMAMNYAWAQMARAKGAKREHSLHCAKTIWSPDNLDYYFNLIAEHRPFEMDDNKRVLFLKDDSPLKGYLLRQHPGDSSSSDTIDDYPPLAALGFALEAVKRQAVPGGFERKRIVQVSSKGWT